MVNQGAELDDNVRKRRLVFSTVETPKSPSLKVWVFLGCMATEYFVSLPANKLELWMALESGRFIAPVFRELYSEKEVCLTFGFRD